MNWPSRVDSKKEKEGPFRSQKYSKVNRKEKGSKVNANITEVDGVLKMVNSRKQEPIDFSSLFKSSVEIHDVYASSMQNSKPKEKNSTLSHLQSSFFHSKRGNRFLNQISSLDLSKSLKDFKDPVLPLESPQKDIETQIEPLKTISRSKTNENDNLHDNLNGWTKSSLKKEQEQRELHKLQQKNELEISLYKEIYDPNHQSKDSSKILDPNQSPNHSHVDHSLPSTPKRTKSSSEFLIQSPSSKLFQEQLEITQNHKVLPIYSPNSVIQRRSFMNPLNTKTRSTISTNFVRLNLKRKLLTKRKIHKRRSLEDSRDSRDSRDLEDLQNSNIEDDTSPHLDSSFNSTFSHSKTQDWNDEKTIEDLRGDYDSKSSETWNSNRIPDDRIIDLYEQYRNPIKKEVLSHEIHPPVCFHGFEAMKRKIKRKSRYQGHEFYCCPLTSQEGRCSFFLWYEESELGIYTLIQSLNEKKPRGKDQKWEHNQRIWNQMKLNDLKVLLKRYHLQSTGTKIQLIQKLEQWGQLCQYLLNQYVYMDSIHDVVHLEDIEKNLEVKNEHLSSYNEIEQENTEEDLIELNKMLETEELEDILSTEESDDSNSIQDLISKSQPSIQSIPTQSLLSQIVESSKSDVKTLNSSNASNASNGSSRSTSSPLSNSNPSNSIPNSSFSTKSSFNLSKIPEIIQNSHLWSQIQNETTLDLQIQFKLYIIAHFIYSLQSFKPGQLWAINRLLHHQSGLFIAPTGSGKSLIYQIPTLLNDCITIIISPLRSLMTNQLQFLPPSLCGFILSGSTTSKQLLELYTMIQNEELNILYISPEKLVSKVFFKLTQLLKFQKRLQFLIIDEVHCMSTWSYNFRPLYLKISNYANTYFPSIPLFGLTATASYIDLHSITTLLHLSEDSIYNRGWKRENITIYIHKTQDKFQSLIKCLKSFYKDSKSCIIYVNKRKETEYIYSFLHEQGYSVAYYHAGLSLQVRLQVESAFYSGKIQIMIATIAFGLGIDKQDITGILHWNPPFCIETYIQEIGRGVRDISLKMVALTLYNEEDLIELYHSIFIHGTEQNNLYLFVSLLFKVLYPPFYDPKNLQNTLENDSNENLPYLQCLDIQKTSKDLDLFPEVLITLLIQLDQLGMIRYLYKGYNTCTIRAVKGTLSQIQNSFIQELIHQKQKELQFGIQSHSCMSFLSLLESLATLLEFGSSSSDELIINIFTISEQLRKTPYFILSEVQKLEQNQQIHCTYSHLSYIYQYLKPQNEISIDSLVYTLYTQLYTIEQNQYYKFQQIYTFLYLCNTSTLYTSWNTELESKNDLMKNLVDLYFQSSLSFSIQDQKLIINTNKPSYFPSDGIPWIIRSPLSIKQQILNETSKILRDERIGNNILNPRVLARIWHGISSESYPSILWSNHSQWGAYRQYDFYELMSIAQEAIQGTPLNTE